MAGKIIADTIETGAGADISTSYVVNGSAKAWVNFTQISTQTVRDSFNISSITDVSSGRTFPISYTSNMSDGNYVGSLYQNAVTGTGYINFDNQYVGGFGSKTTSSFGERSYGSSGDIDSNAVELIIQGDLA